MKQTVNFYSFCDAFQQCRPDNFSREGLSVLWDYFEQYEQDTGEEMELDVIAICCDFAEDTVEGIASNYSIDLDGVADEDKAQAVMDYLCDNTWAQDLGNGSFVYRAF